MKSTSPCDSFSAPEMRLLGDTELRITPIGVGAFAMGGWLRFLNGGAGVIVGASNAEQGAAPGNLAVSLTQSPFDTVNIIADRHFVFTP